MPSPQAARNSPVGQTGYRRADRNQLLYEVSNFVLIMFFRDFVPVKQYLLPHRFASIRLYLVYKEHHHTYSNQRHPSDCPLGGPMRKPVDPPERALSAADGLIDKRRTHSIFHKTGRRFYPGLRKRIFYYLQLSSKKLDHGIADQLNLESSHNLF
ncbi:MAG: hypothetical protein ACTHLE_07975 [Agriterribacter sp.]